MTHISDHDSDFGPEISLVRFLRNLIKDYKRGLGILKEFVQNADDAGATRVVVTMDWRQHSAATLPDGVEAFMGPSLLVSNNRPFRDEDLEHIRTIGESSKAVGAPRIGRFGLGFNTAYNVTDYPSFVTRDRAYCFDPRRSAVASKDPARPPGKQWDLKELWHSYPGWPAVFEAGGLGHGAEFHSGTIFRLPLRTKASEICPEPFDEEQFQALLQQLIDMGPALLLFTRNVMALEVRQFRDGKAQAEQLYSIETENEDEVEAQRAPLNQELKKTLDEHLLASWKNDPEALPQPTYRHHFTVRRNRRQWQEHWQVVTGLFADADGDLLQLAEELYGFGQRVIPWAGAAVRLDVKSHSPVVSVRVQGRLYCGLPLPQESQVGVHLHGYFDLDSSRQAITTDLQTSGTSRKRVEWNDRLMRHAVSRAYAALLEALRDDAGSADPGAWYDLWPRVQSAPTGPLGTLAHELFRQMAPRACIRVQSGAAIQWSAPQQLYLPPSGHWRKELFEPLSADGQPMPDPPLPGFIEDGLNVVKAAPHGFTPADLRTKLRSPRDVACLLENAPRPSLRKRAWVEALLRYCLSEKKPELQGLPLAILCDQKLHTFGYNTAGLMFLADDQERALFPECGHWFIDPTFSEATGLTHERPETKLFRFSPSLVVQNLSVPLKNSGPGPIHWQCEGPNTPNQKWLVAVYRYLTATASDDLKPTISALKKLPLVPDQFGQLRGMDAANCPLLPSSDIPKPLIDALTGLGIPIIKPDRGIRHAVVALDAAHRGLIRPLDGPNLIEALQAQVSQWAGKDIAVRHSAAGQVLDFLVKSEWAAHSTPPQRDALSKLPLLPTKDNELVRAVEPKVYLLGTENSPNIGGKVHLLNLGKGERWRAIYEALGVDVLSDVEYAESVLLPAYPELTREQQRAALRWLRDQPQSDAPAWKSVWDKMKQMSLLLDGSGQLQRAVHLYSPARQDTLTLLAQPARTPDMKFYGEEYEQWLTFFKKLDLQLHPRAEHLLQRIFELMNTAHSEGTDPVREPLLSLLDHLGKRWEVLRDVQVSVTEGGRTLSRKFGEVLKNQAWLPAIREMRRNQEIPGFVAREDRLYKPKEIYEWSRRNLIASQAPILAYRTNLPKELRDGLGIRPPSITLVLQHLDRLVSLWAEPEHGGLQSVQLVVPTREIYHFLGEQTLSSEDTQQLARSSVRPCIWDFRTEQWWQPKHVFRAPVPELWIS